MSYTDIMNFGDFLPYCLLSPPFPSYQNTSSQKSFFLPWCLFVWLWLSLITFNYDCLHEQDTTEENHTIPSYH